EVVQFESRCTNAELKTPFHLGASFSRSFEDSGAFPFIQVDETVGSQVRPMLVEPRACGPNLESNVRLTTRLVWAPLRRPMERKNVRLYGGHRVAVATSFRFSSDRRSTLRDVFQMTQEKRRVEPKPNGHRSDFAKGKL